MLVQVTQSDIDLGARASPCCCPVARAMTRTLGRPVSVRGVDRNGQYSFFVGIDPGPEAAIQLPVSAQSFIQDFDSGRPVRPFEFDIEVEV